MNQTSTIAELAHRVAEKLFVEEACPGCNNGVQMQGYLPMFHHPCNGTGKVKRWPMRVECKGSDYHFFPGDYPCENGWYEEDNRYPKRQCSTCHGLGWIACEDAMVLWRALIEAGVAYNMENGYCKLTVPLWEKSSQSFYGYSDDPELALFQAAAKWVEATCAG